VRQLDEDLAKVTAELQAAQHDLVRLTARIEGLQAQQKALQRAAAAAEVSTDHGGVDLGSMTKARAIVAILKAASGPMGLHDIAAALTDAGKTSKASGVSVYLDGLLKDGLVVRVERGLYTAA
jgi:septal ring factor EnvC (AmiA/AmiB activator)